MRVRHAIAITVVAGTSGLVLSACGGGGEAGSSGVSTAASTTSVQATTATPAGADLSGVKDYLLEHTQLLTGFTEDFLASAQEYHDLTEAAGFDVQALWQERADEVGPLIETLKALWIEGNPYYERVEGVVAGTPSLAEYDVILDAGASATEDPESAVPFDLTLPDGTVLKQPGNLFNLTEGALWGTLPDELGRHATPVDLDGDGSESFGEVLPDPGLLLAAAQAFDRYATELAASGDAWQPADSDAFTALVVMVPTMSEYFGQWKESRFVRGETATSESFNVVSRLSDIRDILGGLDVIYAGVEPLIATEDKAQSLQTGEELDDLIAFIEDLHDEEQAGDRFTPEEADTLGVEAQERATAIAGQVSQAAARLGITIEQ